LHTAAPNATPAAQQQQANVCSSGIYTIPNSAIAVTKMK
jgi:hypothetical protein